jgi:hypothetical protein
MSNKNTRAKERQRWRKRLRAWGMAEDEIELCMAQVRTNLRAKANGTLPIDAPLCTRAEYIHLLKKHSNPGDDKPHFHFGDDYEEPDDKGYAPKRIDPLLKGVARATGATAKVVKKGKTMTKFEYDKET